MKNNYISINLILIIIYLLLLQNTSSYLVFPFSIQKKNKNTYSNINPDYFSYNYTNFFDDNFNQLLYIDMNIDNPLRKIKASLTYEDIGFEIRNSSECINYNIYLNNQEINIKTFVDINLLTVKNFEKINFTFYNGPKIDNEESDLICANIGFQLMKYNQNYNIKKQYDIINNLYSKKYIQNYNWVLKYTSNESGYLIIGTNNLQEIVPNYSENNLFSTKAIISGFNNHWTISIQRISCTCIDNINNQNKSFAINNIRVTADINNDFSFIQGDYKYFEFIEKNFFAKYLNNKICMNNTWYKNKYVKYFVYECIKRDLDMNELMNFPVLTLYSFDSTVKFEFDYKDLFTITQHKIFFNVIFPIHNTDKWVLGKVFLKKYLIIIHPEDNLIKVYLDNNYENNNIKNISNINETSTYNNTINNNTNNIRTKNEEEKNDKKINIKIILIILLFIPFGFLCFYFGRKIRRERRKKANELIDEYDYDSKNDTKDKNKKEKNAINYQNL